MKILSALFLFLFLIVPALVYGRPPVSSGGGVIGSGGVYQRLVPAEEGPMEADEGQPVGQPILQEEENQAPPQEDRPQQAGDKPALPQVQPPVQGGTNLLQPFQKQPPRPQSPTPRNSIYGRGSFGIGQPPCPAGSPRFNRPFRRVPDNVRKSISFSDLAGQLLNFLFR